MDNLFRFARKGLNELKKAQRTIERAKSGSSDSPKEGQETFDLDLNISELPKDVDQFLELRDQFSGTPAGAAAIFLLAMNVFAENRELGLQCLIISVDASLLEDDTDGNGYKGKVLSPRELARFEKLLNDSPETFRGYWDGSGPDNSYSPARPLKVRIYRQKKDQAKDNQYTRASRGVEQTEQRLFVRSLGYRNANNSGRPILLAQNTSGTWKAKNYSGLATSLMRVTVTDDGDDI